MRNLIVAIFMIVSLLSCTNKDYQYIEVYQTQFKSESKETKTEKSIITAKNDTLAFLKGFEKFCISVAAHKKISESTDLMKSEAKSFQLLNENNFDINDIKFKSKDQHMKRIIEKYLDMKVEILDEIGKQ